MSRTINMADHRRWGNNIELVHPFEPRAGGLRKDKDLWARMVGWMPKKPVAGDTILMPTADGQTAVLSVESVEHVQGVADMFFAEVKFIEFIPTEDE